ncbi:MAG: hypothetical protein WEC73_02160, partial [Chthoniobacterales bacterium]
TEDEGVTNETAYRTSGFKDWYSLTGSTGSSAGVNTAYTVTAAGASGWTFSAGGVSKTITLPSAADGELRASYTLSGPSKLFVRFGLSPNLLDLMMRGHEGLTSEVIEGTRASVANASGSEVIRAWVEAPQINSAAVDTAAVTTVQRRNQAQTHQVEVELTGAGPHLVTLGFDGGSDTPTDPFVEYMDDFFPDETDPSIVGPEADPDNDGLTNRQEHILGSNPDDASSGRPRVTATHDGDTFRIEFPTVSGRTYRVIGCDSLSSGGWTEVTNLQQGPGLSSSNPVIGDDSTKVVVEHGLDGKNARFYQVEVELAP